jgi:uroporphyrinogen-III synthase
MKVLYLGLDPSRYVHAGELVHLPIIKIIPRTFEEVKELFIKLEKATHVLLTSRTAASLYHAYALKSGFSPDCLKNKIYLTVGEATKGRLVEIGIKDAIVAPEATGEGVVALLSTLHLQYSHLFFPRSSLGRSLIPEYLRQRKISHTSIDLYQTVPNPANLPDLSLFDRIVFTSPSTVFAFYTLFKQLPPLEKCHCLGPITQYAIKNIYK